MIKTNNRTWRTLEQPLYVNGQKVLEVWADGNLVYPENGAEFIKIRGKVTLNNAYGEDAQNIPGTDSFRQPAYSGVLSGTAEFAACFIRKYYGDNRLMLTNHHQEEMYGGFERFVLNAYPNNDQNRLFGVPKMVTRKTLGFEQTYSANVKEHFTTDRIIYRQNINAFPLLPENSWVWNSYGYPWSNYSWTSRLIRQTFTEAAALNGVHKSAEGEAESTPSSLTFEKTINGLTFRIELVYRQNKGAYLNVYIKQFTRSNGVLFTEASHNGEEVPDWTEDLEVGNSYPLFSVPVTDIMFFGGYYTAPAEMLDVTVADLDF